MSTSAATRPANGRINVHETADYPIILGDSFKNEAASRSQYLRLRYNWEPRHGFTGQKGTLQRSSGRVRLAYSDAKSGSSLYDYDDASRSDTDQEGDAQMNHLALVFDPDKSSYVLEQISQSFDFNLSSAHDQSKDEVRHHKKLGSASEGDEAGQPNGGRSSLDQDADEADPSNPFDFRHFLSEAKENAEKTQPTGNRTPLPGNRTPLSGISSPSLIPGRVPNSNTPQFRPVPRSAPAPKKLSDKPATAVTAKKQTAAKRKPAPAPRSSAPHQPLSNEVVTDSSDDDTQDTITVSQPPAAQTKERAHNRNVSSASIGRSPNIVVSDGELEIDLGSPPPERRRRPAFDPSVFGRQTSTPTLGMSSNKPPTSHSDRDLDMRDRSDEDDDHDEEDDYGHEVDADADADADADMDDDDVPQLELDSPPSKKPDERKFEIEKEPTPLTPLPPHAEDDDDEADLLAAELEAALGEQDDNAMAPGMNIVDDDDESDISEEE